MTHPRQESLTANHYTAVMSNDLHHSQISWIKTVKIDNLGLENGCEVNSENHYDINKHTK